MEPTDTADQNHEGRPSPNHNTPPQHHYITRKLTGSSYIPLRVPARLLLVVSIFIECFNSANGFGFAKFLRYFCVRCFFSVWRHFDGLLCFVDFIVPLFVRSPGEACNVIGRLLEMSDFDWLQREIRRFDWLASTCDMTTYLGAKKSAGLELKRGRGETEKGAGEGRA